MVLIYCITKSAPPHCIHDHSLHRGRHVAVLQAQPALRVVGALVGANYAPVVLQIEQGVLGLAADAGVFLVVEVGSRSWALLDAWVGQLQALNVSQYCVEIPVIVNVIGFGACIELGFHNHALPVLRIECVACAARFAG